LLQQDKAQEAISAFDKAEALHVDARRLPSMLASRAQARFRTQNFMAARRDVDRALALDGADPQVHLVSALIHALAGNLPEAQYAVERSIRLAPQNPGAHLLLARIFSAQEKVDESRAEIALAREQKASPAAL